MTKKYKLIKEYPGNEDLGTVVTSTEDGYYECENGLGFDECEIEEFPEFWEKIK